ncbi:4Fe-4S dicluster domain-containing protein [bacterium]|nr:4Fe-4S dicluster domain-containing protein [bacterium]
MLDTGSWRTVRPVMDKALCNECGICMTFCPVNSIVGDETKAYQIVLTYCKGCGICAVECPQHAILMVPEGGTQA